MSNETFIKTWLVFSFAAMGCMLGFVAAGGYRWEWFAGFAPFAVMLPYGIVRGYLPSGT